MQHPFGEKAYMRAPLSVEAWVDAVQSRADVPFQTDFGVVLALRSITC